MEKIIWELPLKTISESNAHEHWVNKRRRHKQQQFFIRSLFNAEKRSISLPCEVKMVRVGGRQLDEGDNLPMAFKWIRDEIAENLFPEKARSFINKKGKPQRIMGRGDDDPRVTWVYAQEKGKCLGIRIEISSSTPEMQHRIDHECIE